MAEKYMKIVKSKTLDDDFTSIKERYMPFITTLHEKNKLRISDVAMMCYITNNYSRENLGKISFTIEDLIKPYNIIAPFEKKEDSTDYSGLSDLDKEQGITRLKVVSIIAKLKNINMINPYYNPKGEIVGGRFQLNEIDYIPEDIGHKKDHKEKKLTILQRLKKKIAR